MSGTPQIIERKLQKYVAIHTKMNRNEIGAVVPNIYPEILTWVSENSVGISGAPIIRYLSVNYGTGDVDIDVGFPISHDKVSVRDRLIIDTLPEGMYATLIHNGSYENLAETTANLISWGRKNGMKWDFPQGNNLSNWKCRVEHYLIGPTDTQNPNDWKTEVAIFVEK
jgi:effector-binding domain-containing protein